MSVTCKQWLFLGLLLLIFVVVFVASGSGLAAILTAWHLVSFFWILVSLAFGVTCAWCVATDARPRLVGLLGVDPFAHDDETPPGGSTCVHG